jgi:prepilin-type processing-associated H-X9-DG protein
VKDCLQPGNGDYDSDHNGVLNILFCDGHVEALNFGPDGTRWEYPNSDIILHPGYRGAPQ